MPTLAFWRAAGGRALRTALTVLTPWVPAVITAGVAGDWSVALAAGSSTALAVVVSGAHSLLLLPELTGATVPLWRALLNRAARQAGHVLVATIAGAQLLTDVDWRTLAIQGAASVIGTVLLGVLARLPETTTPTPEG